MPEGSVDELEESASEEDSTKPKDEGKEENGGKLGAKGTVLEGEEKSGAKESDKGLEEKKLALMQNLQTLQSSLTQINSNASTGNQTGFPPVITGPVSQPTLMFMSPQNIASYMQLQQQQQQNMLVLQPSSYINGQSIVGNGQTNGMNFGGQFNGFLGQGDLQGLGSQLMIQQPQIQVMNSAMYSVNNSQQNMINSQVRSNSNMQVSSTMNSNPAQLYYQMRANVNPQSQQAALNYPQMIQSPMYMVTTPSAGQTSFQMQNLGGNMNNFAYQPTGYIVIKGDPNQFQLGSGSQQGQ